MNFMDYIEHCHKNNMQPAEVVSKEENEILTRYLDGNFGMIPTLSVLNVKCADSSIKIYIFLQHHQSISGWVEWMSVERIDTTGLPL